MIARGDLNYLITAPTDKDQMVGPLKAAVDAGIKVITVDTFLGDANYATGSVSAARRGGDQEAQQRVRVPIKLTA